MKAMRFNISQLAFHLVCLETEIHYRLFSNLIKFYTNRLQDSSPLSQEGKPSSTKNSFAYNNLLIQYL